jgi:hypothetical protein
MSSGPSGSKQSHETADKSLIVDAHVAEYEALMTRNTYWVTIQFSTAPAIAIYFTLLAAILSALGIVQPAGAAALQKSILWVAVLGAELFVIAGYMCLYEIYNNVRYVESHLRPEMDKLLPNQNYWKYEDYIAKHRGFGALLNEWWAIVAVFGALVFVAVHARSSWNSSDSWWFAASLAVSTAMVARALEVSKMRLRGFRDDPTSIPKVSRLE